MADADMFRALEQRRLLSLVDVNMTVAEQLHADDYQLITPGGRTLDKRDYLDGVAQGVLDYAVFEPASEIAVLAGVDIVCLRYQALIDITFGEGEHDRGLFWHTDIWAEREQGWQAVWSHATRT
ncbi:MAG TPA: nuclear transport factor 2 family protein [Nocardioidaceae bacterium]|nr:nuclear transport factor 2 family protein [Nocardioidaceae bacterium]